jgi:hypothetical protein
MSHLGGTPPNTSSIISRKDVVGGEAVHLEERTLVQWLWAVLRGGLKQRVSEEENRNSAIVIIPKCYSCKKYICFVFQR